MKAPEGQGPFYTCLARLRRIGSLGLSNTCAPIDVLKEHIVSVAGSLPQVFRVSKARPRSSTIPPEDKEGTDSYETLLSGQHQSSPQQPPPHLRTPRCHNLFVFERGHDGGTDGTELENVTHIRLPIAGAEITKGDGEAKPTATEPNEGAGPFMFMRKLAVIQLKTFKRCHL